MVGTKNIADRPNGPFAALFAPIAPRARTFFTGKLCQTAQFNDEGHLHLLKGGELTVVQTGQGDLRFDEPTLLFFPLGRVHSFAVNPKRGADLVCAIVELGGAEGKRHEEFRVARILGMLQAATDPYLDVIVRTRGPITLGSYPPQMRLNDGAVGNHYAPLILVAWTAGRKAIGAHVSSTLFWLRVGVSAFNWLLTADWARTQSERSSGTEPRLTFG